MSKNTKIEWTDHTFNPWWGCHKVSAGCALCYANTFSNRIGYDIWGPNKPRRFMSDKVWLEPLKWNQEAIKQRTRMKVFCASMADVFEDNDSVIEARARLWLLILQTPMLDWLLVTKRPENIMRFIPEDWKNKLPSNLWVLTSVENQEVAEIRIPELLKVPAVVRGCLKTLVFC